MESTAAVKMELMPVLEDEIMLTRIKEEPELDTVSDSEGALFDVKPVKREFCEGEAEDDEPEDGSAHTPDGGQDVCSKLEIEDNSILEESYRCRQSPELGGLQIKHNIVESSVEATDQSVPDIEIPVQKGSYKCHFCNMGFSRVADLVLHTRESHTYWKETVYVRTIMESEIPRKPEAVWVLEDDNMLTHLKDEQEPDTVSDSEGASFDVKPVKREFCEVEVEENEPENGRAHTPDAGQDMCSKLEIEDNNILKDSSRCKQSPELGGLQVRHKVAGSSVESTDHPEPDIEIPVQKESYKCHFCYMGFSRVVDLVLHTRKSHTGAKPFTCEHCKKCFGNRHDRYVHIRTHTGEKPYSCEYCNECFTQISSLYEHRRKHNGKKPFFCEYCNKKFIKKNNLISHKITHADEKPFSCEHCDKCFKRQSGLITHRRTHTGEKPFSCEHCIKCFTNGSALIVHRRTHTGEKPFSCEFCNKCYTQRSSLTYHVWKHHHHVVPTPDEEVDDHIYGSI